MSATDSWGQSLSIYNIDATAFPVLTAKFYAFDLAGNRISPTAAELSLAENGTRRAITSIVCPPPASGVSISSVLTLDVSGSMSGGSGGVPRIDIAKAAARAWVTLLAGKSDCAITSFDNENYLNQDFTNDKSKLNSTINRLSAGGGTDYDKGLLNPTAGALEVTKTGTYKRIIVFLTDGTSNEVSEAAIVDEAKKQNCIIHVVTIGMQCPEQLKNISEQTGGLWFEKIESVSEAETVYRLIFSISQNSLPCSIQWNSVRCASGERKVEISDGLSSATTSYVVAENLASRLTINPSSILFRPTSVGVALDTVITVTAERERFVVTDVASSNPAFSVTPRAFTLSAGESKTLRVQYIPSDSGYAWSEFSLISDNCNHQFYASGNILRRSSQRPTLKLDAPNGREMFVVGALASISWAGLSPGDTVKLDYSTNNGTTWNSIVDKTVGGSFQWLIPNSPSDSCLVRVSTLQGTHSTSGGYSLVQTLPGKQWEQHRIKWSPDGTTVATVGDSGALTLWDPYTGEKLNTATVPGIRYEHMDWHPDGSRILFSGWLKPSKSVVTVWNARSWTKENDLITAEYWNPYVAKWNAEGTLIATTGIRGAAIWDGFGRKVHDIARTGDWLVRDVSWSPDDSKIVTGGNSLGRIWDVKTGVEISPVIQGPGNGGLFIIAWSPDGSRIATTAGNQNVRVYDATTGALIVAYPIFNTPIGVIKWNHDGSRLLTTQSPTSRGLMSVYNSSTNTAIFSDSISSDLIRHADWSPDGLLIAYSCDFKNVSILDASTGKRIQVLEGHASHITDVEFSPDGAYVATASGDGTSKIWRVIGDALMVDSSDAMFSIVRPDPQANDVDMRRAIIGSSKDSVVQGFVLNTGTYPFQIDSVTLSGVDAASFSVVSGFGPIAVEPSSQHPVEFRFAPLTIGSITAALNIYTSGAVLTKSIIGEGVAKGIEVIGSLVDFDTVLVHTSKTQTQLPTIKNVGTVPITITGMRMGGPNNTDFSTSIVGQPGFTLAPSESAPLIDVTFNANELGRTTGQLLFDYDGVGSPASIMLFANSVDSMRTGKASLQISFGSSKVGEIIYISIMLTSDSNLINMKAMDFTGQLRFNATLLEPLSPLVLGPLTGSEGVVDIRMPSTPDSNGVLTTVQFRAALGNDSTCVLSLENMQAVGGNVTITSEPGQFTLDGICLAGGPRLLNPNGSIDLVSTGQNPILTGFTEVTIETSEVGRTSLVLRDMRGRVVKTFINGEVSSGRRVIVLDVSDVASAAYMLTLRTPTEQRTIRIAVAP